VAGAREIARLFVIADELEEAVGGLSDLGHGALDPGLHVVRCVEVDDLGDCTSGAFGILEVLEQTDEESTFVATEHVHSDVLG
jgi:hypothetical protein